MSISNIIPEPSQSDHPTKAKSKRRTKRTASNPDSKKAATASTSTPANATSTPANAKKINKEKGGVARAIALRKKFPTIQNIPNSITPAQKKKLTLRYTQNSVATLQPTHSGTNEGPEDGGPAPTTYPRNSEKAANNEKQRKRAASLKQQYPDMEGIPSKIGQGTKKKLVAQYKAKSSGLAPSVTMPASSSKAARNGPRLNDVPSRPVPSAPISGTDPTSQSVRLHEIPANSSATSEPGSQRPTSYKMAPLSEERRAEVARNFAAGSNDDPVMVD